LKITNQMISKNFSKNIKLLLLSFIPIFIGPVFIHLGGINDSIFLVISGISFCVIAISMIFTSIFRIISELFKK